MRKNISTMQRRATHGKAREEQARLIDEASLVNEEHN